ncbi:MAG TPA: histidine phosphatase family protein [Acidimicrobiales bacterium]|nr:histidine phosphatase family protein [Acidimicrobiales bacterium]
MWIARHGQTEWSLSGQHTGTTDLELTDDGVDQARALGARLSDVAFTCVLTSPYKGARHTAELAGVAEALQIDDDLGEMRYGMARAVPPRRCWVDITQLARIWWRCPLVTSGSWRSTTGSRPSRSGACPDHPRCRSLRVTHRHGG